MTNNKMDEERKKNSNARLAKIYIFQQHYHLGAYIILNSINVFTRPACKTLAL